MRIVYRPWGSREQQHFFGNLFNDLIKYFIQIHPKKYVTVTENDWSKILSETILID